MAMANLSDSIDRFFSRTLGNCCTAWPDHWNHASTWAAVVDRALYHGIAGLLIEGRPIGWPKEVFERLHQQAIAQEMWEVRHRQMLTRLLAELRQNGIKSLILKGTALAYDLYAKPATRARGDTDLLVKREELEQTRLALAKCGFCLAPPCAGRSDDLELQEIWNFASGDGTNHVIDLHWQAMNSMALRQTLVFADCAANKRVLPLLDDNAFTMDRATMLIHASMHRATHITSPYMVDGVTYYGGDRLIWAYDIHLLAGALSQAEWSAFCETAIRMELAPVCLDGLKFAMSHFDTVVSSGVMERLGQAPASASGPSIYLLELGQAGRALQDLKAVKGLRNKVRFLAQRTLPPANFLRGKYPSMQNFPLAALYVRRIIDLLRSRPDRVKN